MGMVLGRYDAAAIQRLFEEEGIFQALAQKGFAHLEVKVDSEGRALPHALLFGRKGGQDYLLLDACIGDAVVRRDFLRRRGYPTDRSIDLAVVHWIREEDPTTTFAPGRPPLPLQQHPGLGVLRHAFRVLVRMASELNKDGVVSTPKFFHDAVIFFHSRLFLFLDGEEQGRFEALVRDLRRLSLRIASLAMTSGGIRDQRGAVVQWAPGYQVFPLSATLTAYFHSSQYAAQVAAGLSGSRYYVDPEVLSYLDVSLSQFCPP
ncbi:MAG: hypothetical protein ACHQ9S_13510 [Candidatus Binatia bacterium]